MMKPEHDPFALFRATPPGSWITVGLLVVLLMMSCGGLLGSPWPADEPPIKPAAKTNEELGFACLVVTLALIAVVVLFCVILVVVSRRRDK